MEDNSKKKCVRVFGFTASKGRLDKTLDLPLKPEVLASDGVALESEDEEDSATEHQELPVKTLGFFIMCVYAYLILPLPYYMSGLFLGVGLGFMTAVCMIWFFTPPSAHKHHKSIKGMQNEPHLFSAIISVNYKDKKKC